MRLARKTSCRRWQPSISSKGCLQHGLTSKIVTVMIILTYEECARDKLCDRTATYREARC